MHIIIRYQHYPLLLFRDRVWVLLSTLPGKELIGSSLMIERTGNILPLLTKLTSSNNNSHGDNLVGVGPEVVEGIQTLVFPSHSPLSNTNDKCERAKIWCLCHSGRVFRRTLFRLLSLPASSKLCCCAINFQTKKPKLYINFGLMMSGPFPPPKPFKVGFLWIRSY